MHNLNSACHKHKHKNPGWKKWWTLWKWFPPPTPGADPPEEALTSFLFLFCLQAASGKFTPLDQWLYFDAYECLPEEGCAVHLTEADCAPVSDLFSGLCFFNMDLPLERSSTSPLPICLLDQSSLCAPLLNQNHHHQPLQATREKLSLSPAPSASCY